VARQLAEVLAPGERATTHVVLVGRGSTDPDANSEVVRAARLLEERAVHDGGALGGVEASFVSLAVPGVPAALERCRRLGATRVVVMPLFMFAGVLPNRIVTQAREWAAAHRAVEVRTGEVIGDSDLLAEVVEDRYLEAAAAPVRAGCDTCMYRTPMPGFEHRVGQPQTPHDHPDDPVGHGHGHGLQLPGGQPSVPEPGAERWSSRPRTRIQRTCRPDLLPQICNSCASEMSPRP
jgi:sirohydrochlorin cobaltochelatase